MTVLLQVEEGNGGRRGRKAGREREGGGKDEERRRGRAREIGRKESEIEDAK